MSVAFVRSSARPTLAEPFAVPAASVRDGSLLAELAKNWATIIAREQLFKFASKRIELTYATTCSGSCGDHFVMREIRNAFAESLHVEIEFILVFVCEIDAKKASWAAKVTEKSGCCVFGDVRDLLEGTAMCQRHNRKCVVKPCKLLISGFSCKGFSSQNNFESDPSTLLAGGKSNSSTYITFWSNNALIDRCGVEMVLYENLDNMDQDPAATADVPELGCRFMGFLGVQL
jgi:hypothetical protein